MDLYPFVRPLLWALDPETAHRLTIRALAAGLVPAAPVIDDPVLVQTLWGQRFVNPVGLAPGFDKHGDAVDALPRLGFGFLEIGGVTPLPQHGNPRPRLFRLAEDGAVINRMGLNSVGQDVVRARLAARRCQVPVGINLGKNKDTQDAAADYVKGVAAFAPVVDFLVCNVSSPNTPGLRALQGRAILSGLIDKVQAELTRVMPTGAPPLLLKIAPDLTDDDKRDIAEVALAARVDGLVIGNTTIDRPAALRSAHRNETGGLSGRPLFAKSTRVLADLYQLTGGKIPLVGVGGIASGADAYAKIRAGASLVQLYSALVYAGPALVPAVIRDLATLLRQDGFARVVDAVGADHRV
jgi:dihydroorotate dehydrogenase